MSKALALLTQLSRYVVCSGASNLCTKALTHKKPFKGTGIHLTGHMLLHAIGDAVIPDK